MKTLHEDSWKRRGISLLWDSSALELLSSSQDAASIRQLYALVGHWPEDLPSNNGNSLIVAGLEACLDLLSPKDAEQWLENDLRSVILSFQSFYNSNAALIFWLPSGRQRIQMNRASETYTWVCAAPHNHQSVELGRILWAGAEADAARILNSKNTNVDPDGSAWIGLHHARLS
jgi:hypothetical protein